MEFAIELTGWLCVLLGAFFIVTGSLGIIRMPDFFTRLHPASVTDSLGAPLVLFGLMILYGVSFYSGKLFLLVVFLFITGPTSTHALAKCAKLMMGGKKQ